MLNYTIATRIYEGRKDKHLGRKVRNHVYMKFDQTRDCFILSQVWAKYERVPSPDCQGRYTYQKAPKERWESRPFAEIHRTHILITRVISNTPMYALFRVRSYVSRTVKLSGRTWVYKDSTRNLQEINGDLPIMIKDDKLSSLAPPKIRVVDPEKRKEMNRTIQSIRNLMKVRTKLGAFDKLTPVQVDEHMRQANVVTKWQVFSNPAKFLELLNAVNPEDLKSFYPLLWLADENWYYRNRTDSYGRVDWVARYNNLVDRMREKMRRELGVVEYVEADERSAEAGRGAG